MNRSPERRRSKARCSKIWASGSIALVPGTGATLVMLSRAVRKPNEQNNRPDRRRSGDYPKGAQPLSFKTLECRQGWANGGAVSLGIDDAIARFQIDPRDRESGLFGILDGFLMHAASIWHLLR